MTSALLLEALSSTLLINIIIHKTTIDVLYHSLHHLEFVRELVLLDVEYRSIKSPGFCHITASIRSTHGQVYLIVGPLRGRSSRLLSICSSLNLSTGTVLIPQSLQRCLPSPPRSLTSPLLFICSTLRLGPIRSTQKAFKIGHGVSVKLTSDETLGNGGASELKQDPITTVGMVVNMTGASNTAKLWEGCINAYIKVARFLSHFYAILTRFLQMYSSQRAASKLPTTPMSPIQNQPAPPKPTLATSFIPLHFSTADSLTFLHVVGGVWTLNNVCYILLMKRLRILG
jgi:hypothetical protein